MASGEASKVMPGGDITGNSETTVEIKIKTLDSQTYTLRVDKCVPVPALKEQIASITGVLSEQQRLICRGTVLKDDQLLSAYHVEDGHTLHLVVRQPPHSSTPLTSHMGSEGTSPAPGSANNHGSQMGHSFVFESVNLDQGDLDASVISRIISSMLDSIGSANGGTGNISSDVREMITERLQRASSDRGVSDSTQPHPNPTNPQSDRPHRVARSSPTVLSGPQSPTVIPDSLTTLSQYLALMRDDFRRDGFAGTNVRDHISSAEAAGVRPGEGWNQDSLSPAAQVGLPTPASLAEILISTRHLLMEQTGDCLSQLANQLGDHSSITDPSARMNVQSSVMRSGVLMRNLGSMLLELSRTTMTLRMGQSPAEAVVNAGPANFISATGPNPLMVQAVPFYPGVNTSGSVGPVNSGHGLEGEPPDAPFVPRNIEIRIRTIGRAVPVGSTNTNEPAGAQQHQEQTDPTRNSSGVNVVNQALSGGDSGGVRMVPLRTVVAVPSGVNPLPSDLASSSVRLFYPLVARVRHTGANSVSDAIGTHGSSQTHQGSSEVDRQPLHQSPVQRENLDSNGRGSAGDDTVVFANNMPVEFGPCPPANESAAHQAAFVSSQQGPNNNSETRTQATDDTVRGIDSHDAARAVAVIMMSADGGTNTVMRGITHGACDYLIKPVRIEELKNIWQHVIRKKCNENRVLEYSGSMDDSDHSKRVAEDTEYASSVNDGADGPWKSHKKKRDATEEEEEGEVDHEDPSSKKPRVVWSVELHQQFVSAVSHLGIEKAVPKRILELMNVPGLTRENVASHLQKFRLYLKRISGVVPYQNGLPTSICGPMEPNTKVGSVGRLDFQALAASGQIPTQTLAALHAELLGRPSGSLALPAIDQPVLHASREGPKCMPAEREVAYGQPLFKCQLSISKQFPPSSVAIENASTGFLAWSSNHLGTTDSIKNIEGLNNTQNSKIMMPIFQQQQPYHVITEPQHVINVQPSCLVVPSQSSNSADVGLSSLPLNQNSTVVPSQLSKAFQSKDTSPAINPNPNLNGSNVVLNYSLFSSPSNSASLGVPQASDGDITNLGVLNGSPGTISSSVASCSARTNIDRGWRVQHQNMNRSTGLYLKLPNLCTQEPEPNTWRSSEPGQARNHGFVGKGTCIPSRFAVDDIDSPTNDQISRSTCIRDDGARVKQELHLDFTDASNFTGVLSQ